MILARLVLINDHLIEFLKWAIENDKPDFAVKLAPIPKAFASIIEEMGAKQLEVFKRPRKKKVVKKSRI